VRSISSPESSAFRETRIQPGTAAWRNIGLTHPIEDHHDAGDGDEVSS
jgi:hypothetical protein